MAHLCPECHGKATVQGAITYGNGSIRRYKRCKACKLSFVTMEVPLPKKVELFAKYAYYPKSTSKNKTLTLKFSDWVDLSIVYQRAHQNSYSGRLAYAFFYTSRRPSAPIIGEYVYEDGKKIEANGLTPERQKYGYFSPNLWRAEPVFRRTRKKKGTLTAEGRDLRGRAKQKGPGGADRIDEEDAR